MRPHRIVTSFLISLLICASANILVAQTIYVGLNGNNYRNVQQAQNRNTPFRTIQRAHNAAGPGARIVVLDGTYYENVSVDKPYLKFVSENKHGAKIVGSVFVFDTHNVEVSGFDISNRQVGNSRSKGVNFIRCYDIIARDLKVHDCRGGGIAFDQCDTILCEWNEVFRNAFYDVAQHSGISVYQPQQRDPDQSGWYGVVVRNNTSYFNENFEDNPLFGRPTDGNGIVIDDSQNLTAPTGNNITYPRRMLVENNLCFQNGGQGVHVYQSNNVYVRNNTLSTNMKSFDFGGEVSVVRSEGARVYNNILIARSGKNAGLQFETANAWWDYNIIHNGSTREARNGPNTIYADPQLGFDFKPTANSPAINSGLTHGGIFFLDVNGMPRIINGSIDRGSAERF